MIQSAVPDGAATKANALIAPADLLLSEHVTAAYNGPQSPVSGFRVVR